MLLLARRLSSRQLFRLSGRGRWWDQVPSQHPNFPIVALTNIKTAKVSLELHRIALLALNLNSRAPFSGIPSLIAYNSRGVLIDLADMVAEMHLIEQVCIIFLECLPTINRSCVCHKN